MPAALRAPQAGHSHHLPSCTHQCNHHSCIYPQHFRALFSLQDPLLKLPPFLRLLPTYTPLPSPIKIPLSGTAVCYRINQVLRSVFCNTKFRRIKPLCYTSIAIPVPNTPLSAPASAVISQPSLLSNPNSFREVLPMPPFCLLCSQGCLRKL